MRPYSLIIVALLLVSASALPIARAQPLDTFSLNFSSSTLSIQQGGSGHVYITVDSINNFSAPVSLSFSDVPIDASITFDSNPVTPPPGGSTSSTASFSVAANVPANTYRLTLIGSSGSDVKNYDFSLQVISAGGPADFSIEVSPQTVTTPAGGTASAVVTITSINVFSTPVTLTSSGQPSGVNVDFSPGTVTPAPGGYVNSAVSVSVATSVSQGYYPLTITGSGSGGASAVIISRSTELGLQVSSPQDFTITVNPSSLNIQQGQSKTATIVVTPIGGFSAQVGLSTSTGAPSGVQIVFSPNPSAAGSLTMSIVVGAFATTGTFTFQILGTSGSLTHATTFTLTISQGAQTTFSLSASSRTITVGQGRSTTTIIIVSSIGGFLSSVNTYTTWVGAAPAGVTVGGPGSLTPPPGGASSAPLTVSATPSASVGSYVLSVVGTSGALSNSVMITVTITQGVTPDFSITASPTVISIGQGASGNSVITILSQDGFSSSVALSVSWVGTAPSGVRFNLPGPVIPPPNAATMSSLTVSAGQASSVGTYTLNVTGNSGSMIHGASVTVQISASALTTSMTNSTSSSSSSNSTTTSSTSPKCFIATATFGSPLAPQVQFLRNLRDQDIMNTYVGWNFMIAFDAWYYSFSPSVAQSITRNPTEQFVMKTALLPLIAILRLGATPFGLLPAHQELAAVVSGLIITSLLGATYLSLPFAALCKFLPKRRFKVNRARMVVATILMLSLAGILVADLAASSPLMVLATVSTALSSLLLSTLTISGLFLQICGRPSRQRGADPG